MSPCTTSNTPLIPLDDALGALLARIECLPTEKVPLDQACGRILAEEIRADRPSPPVDVSAMDGYAVNIEDIPTLVASGLPVNGEAIIGAPVRSLEAGTAMRIFTGCPVPNGADAVIKREDLVESPERIRCAPDLSSITHGMHIRCAGENARAGDQIVPSGVDITSAVIASLAAFGITEPLVRRRVRVAIIVTGDEVADTAGSPTPTSLRDSNGPMLRAMLGQIGWVDVVGIHHVPDNPEQLRAVMDLALSAVDCVFTTGGVSMGDHDYVPDTAVSLGGEPVFHRLAIKPGKPVFTAVFPEGKLLVGLPGNPVSALVTTRIVALPAIAVLAGAPTTAAGPNARCFGENIGTKSYPLERFLLIDQIDGDRVHAAVGRGSGDIAALARSRGVVRVPINATGNGPFDCYYWSMP